MIPDAIKYQITLENEQRLRMRAWVPQDDDADNDDVSPTRPASWSDLAATPSSRLAVWILRRPNRRWWLAAGLVPVYLVIAYASWSSTPASDGLALAGLLVAVLAAWNATKFAVIAVIATARRSAR